MFICSCICLCLCLYKVCVQVCTSVYKCVTSGRIRKLMSDSSHSSTKLFDLRSSHFSFLYDAPFGLIPPLSSILLRPSSLFHFIFLTHMSSKMKKNNLEKSTFNVLKTRRLRNTVDCRVRGIHTTRVTSE